MDDVLAAFRLPQKKQQMVLPSLLRNLKVLLEGHYQPTQSSKPKGVNVVGGAAGLRSGKTGLSRMQNFDE